MIQIQLLELKPARRVARPVPFIGQKCRAGLGRAAGADDFVAARERVIHETGSGEGVAADDKYFFQLAGVPFQNNPQFIAGAKLSGCKSTFFRYFDIHHYCTETSENATEMKIETNPALSGRAGAAQPAGLRHPLGWTALILAVILAVLFWRAFLPDYVAFGNDDPLGAMAAEQNSVPSTMTGLWQDLNWLGNEGLSPSPNMTTALRLVTSPRMFLNIFCPASLFIVGICACFCLRQFKLTPMACMLGGLAAGLNSDFLSTASWGVASQTICMGANYLAVGLLAGAPGRRAWVRVVLAGMAVGMGVMEGYDIGAIFSLFVAAFALYQALFLSQGETAQKLGRGVARIALLALFAGFIAVHSLSVLVGTQIKDVSGTQQDEQTRALRWSYATQFSFPPAETFQVLVPGIFGYRNYWHMYENSQPKDDQYWGPLARDPACSGSLGPASTPGSRWWLLRFGP